MPQQNGKSYEYDLYGFKVPPVSSLNADALLKAFPRPGFGRGRVQKRNEFVPDRVDDFDPRKFPPTATSERPRPFIPAYPRFLSGLKFEDAPPALPLRFAGPFQASFPAPFPTPYPAPFPAPFRTSFPAPLPAPFPPPFPAPVPAPFVPENNFRYPVNVETKNESLAAIPTKKMFERIDPQSVHERDPGISSDEDE